MHWEIGEMVESVSIRLLVILRKATKAEYLSRSTRRETTINLCEDKEPLGDLHYALLWSPCKRLTTRSLYWDLNGTCRWPNRVSIISIDARLSFLERIFHIEPKNLQPKRCTKSVQCDTPPWNHRSQLWCDAKDFQIFKQYQYPFSVIRVHGAGNNETNWSNYERSRRLSVLY